MTLINSSLNAKLVHVCMYENLDLNFLDYFKFLTFKNILT